MQNKRQGGDTVRSDRCSEQLSRSWLSFLMSGTMLLLPLGPFNRVPISLANLNDFSIIRKKRGFIKIWNNQITLSFVYSSKEVMAGKFIELLYFALAVVQELERITAICLFILGTLPPSSKQVDRLWVSCLRGSLSYGAARSYLRQPAVLGLKTSIFCFVLFCFKYLFIYLFGCAGS